MTTFTIDADFPGGNILVEGIDGETVTLRQDPRDTPEWWFYWRFRVRGAAGRTLRFLFTDGDVFGARGPCVSLDGQKWRWLGRGIVRDNGFAFTFPPGKEEVYFSFCLPYQESHLHDFLAAYPRIQTDILTHSEGGRAVEHLALHAANCRGKVLFTARHHACESMANYVLEGLFAVWMGHSPDANFLRNHIDFHAIPFMDKDGVENGDQGKCRFPHDHNRDYIDAPRYASVRALTSAVDSWRGPLLLHIDLHCPWIRDGWNEEIFAVGTKATQDEKIHVLLTGLAALSAGDPLPFTAEHYLPFGVDWNVEGATSTNFTATHPQRPLAVVFEFPYALAGGQTVTPHRARLFGRSLGKAIARFLH